MDGISGEQDTSSSEALGDEGDPGCPRLMANHLKWYFGACAASKNIPDLNIVG
jgi:hypothetical protein